MTDKMTTIRTTTTTMIACVTDMEDMKKYTRSFRQIVVMIIMLPDRQGHEEVQRVLETDDYETMMTIIISIIITYDRHGR